ncbi:Regulator of chromosome condensation (RCC1) repeat [Carpediemonas membranifera]|uniref:Regulator of chromosome condensation (RCC1) repeat n=1 Tax=Carpediemonas membranifera TaxID=201153 RepID=A0A8J6E665_9EUKA|nr:Regulator of chromosome condensation (RCC1) repeat [Carpediemonas membranifera]|eukprot:KAG9396727.1 Regulator of chromosome condensation (RCC1) repeat [Carpediemonas membranifera]
MTERGEEAAEAIHEVCSYIMTSIDILSPLVSEERSGGQQQTIGHAMQLLSIASELLAPISIQPGNSTPRLADESQMSDTHDFVVSDEEDDTPQSPEDKLSAIAGSIEAVSIGAEGLLSSFPGDIPTRLRRAAALLGPGAADVGGVDLIEDKAELIDRLRSIRGQLQALQPELDGELDPDCCRRLDSVVRQLENPTTTLDVSEVPVFWALSHSTITAVMFAAGLPEAASFTCVRMAHSKVLFDKAETIRADGCEYRLLRGGLYSRGLNLNGEAGRGRADLFVPEWGRVCIPSVTGLWTGHGSAVAATVAGVFAWGSNKRSKLSFPEKEGIISSPRLVGRLDVVRAVIMDESTFLQTPTHWRATGANEHGQLAVGHRDPVREPERVVGSETITDVVSDCGTAFAWTETGDILGAGSNDNEQLGVTAGDDVTVFSPVNLPPNTSVVRIVEGEDATFFFTADRRCLVCGNNRKAKLGLPRASVVVPPTALPFAVDDVVFNKFTTVFLCDGKLMAVGDNSYRELPSTARELTAPTELPLPWDAVQIILGCKCLFVQRDDGQWFARGDNSFGQLGVGSIASPVTTLAPVALDNVRWVHSASSMTLFMTADGLYRAGIRIDGEIGEEDWVNMPRVPVQTAPAPDLHFTQSPRLNLVRQVEDMPRSPRTPRSPRRRSSSGIRRE